MSDSTPVREKVLGAAERLFADSGYHAVTVRDITQAAGVRLASVNDHFGGKEMLFKAVIAQRADAINQDRLELLHNIESGGNRERTVEQIVEAFARPLLVRSEESEGWRNYMRLVAQLNNSRSEVLMLIAEHFNPIANQFVEAIGVALPELDRRQQLIAYQLMLSAVMTVFADNYRIDVMSDNAFHSSDFATHFDDLVRYATGGLLALVDFTGT